MEDKKRTLKDINDRLHLKLQDGKRPTRAVEEVAEENYFNNIKPNSLSTIWRCYIKLKKNIE